MFSHSSRCVRLAHCFNAGIFKRALRQVRFYAAPVLLNHNKVRALHGRIIRPDEFRCYDISAIPRYTRIIRHLVDIGVLAEKEVIQ